jgi:hypothetical protein
MINARLYATVCLLSLWLTLPWGCSKEESLTSDDKITSSDQSIAARKAAPAGSIVVYQHCNYSGYAITLGVGNYTLTNLISRGIKNDDLSSLQVASGYKATLYWDDNYNGSSIVKTSDVSCMVGDGWNDKVSSIKVEKNDTGTGTWRKANLTNYESYPDPNSDECIQFNGCFWAGQFAFLSGVQPESWVKANNIAAVHSKDASKYKLKRLLLRQGSRQIEVKVYDMCSDSDCNGCCTQNASETGFLIDIEKYTMQRFGSGSGIVEYMCLDCD